MPRYLTPAEYPSVRAAIDISLDASNLPDDVIGLTVYAGEAERWVLVMNPLAALYTPGSVSYLKTQVAAIYACAALVMPAVPILTGETFEDGYRYTRDKIDPAKLQSSLWDRANAAIREALGPANETSSRPPARFIFTRAPGKRNLLI